MSYSIKIVKDGGGLRLEPIQEAALHHIPDGMITVTGHHVPAGEQGTESYGVMVQPADGGPQFSSAGWSTVDRRKVATA